MRSKHKHLKVVHPWSPRERLRAGIRWTSSIRFFEVFTERGMQLTGLTAAELTALDINPFVYLEPSQLRRRVNRIGTLTAWVYALVTTEQTLELRPIREQRLRAEEVLYIRHFRPCDSVPSPDVAAAWCVTMPAPVARLVAAREADAGRRYSEASSTSM